MSKLFLTLKISILIILYSLSHLSHASPEEKKSQSHKVNRNNNTSWESERNDEDENEEESTSNNKNDFLSLKDTYLSTSLGYALDDFNSGYEWLNWGLKFSKLYLKEYPIQLISELDLDILNAIKTTKNENQETSKKNIYILKINTFFTKKLAKTEPYLGFGFGISSSLYPQDNDLDSIYSLNFGLKFQLNSLPLLIGLNNEIKSFSSLRKNIFTLGIFASLKIK